MNKKLFALVALCVIAASSSECFGSSSSSSSSSSSARQRSAGEVAKPGSDQDTKHADNDQWIARGGGGGGSLMNAAAAAAEAAAAAAAANGAAYQMDQKDMKAHSAEQEGKKSQAAQSEKEIIAGVVNGVIHASLQTKDVAAYISGLSNVIPLGRNQESILCLSKRRKNLALIRALLMSKCSSSADSASDGSTRLFCKPQLEETITRDYDTDEDDPENLKEIEALLAEKIKKSEAKLKAKKAQEDQSEASAAASSLSLLDWLRSGGSRVSGAQSQSTASQRRSSSNSQAQPASSNQQASVAAAYPPARKMGLLQRLSLLANPNSSDSDSD